MHHPMPQHSINLKPFLPFRNGTIIIQNRKKDGHRISILDDMLVRNDYWDAHVTLHAEIEIETGPRRCGAVRPLRLDANGHM